MSETITKDKKSAQLGFEMYTQNNYPDQMPIQKCHLEQIPFEWKISTNQK